MACDACSAADVIDDVNSSSFAILFWWKNMLISGEYDTTLMSITQPKALHSHTSRSAICRPIAINLGIDSSKNAVTSIKDSIFCIL